MSGSSCKRFCRKCKAHSFSVAAHTLCPFSKCQCAVCVKINQNNEVARERARKRRADQAAGSCSSSTSTAVTIEQVLTIADSNSCHDEQERKKSTTSLQAEKLKQRRKQLSEYDCFINGFMGSLSEEQKTRSPLSNMALATKAWMAKQKRPISSRVMKTSARQEDELKTLGFNQFNGIEHLNLGLPSSLGTGVDKNTALLADLLPQLPPPQLEKHLTSANGEVEKAIDMILLETPTQDQISSPTGTSVVKDPGYVEVLSQMFPQYQQDGISCALQSCNNNFYDTIDLLLKLLPEESRRRDSPTPEIIQFSKTASTAVNHVPTAPQNPFAMALSSPSTSTGMRKAHFCKRCGNRLPDSFMGGNCPITSCGYPFQVNIRM